MIDIKVIEAGGVRTGQRSALLLSLVAIAICALILASTLALGRRTLRNATASGTGITSARVVIAVEGMHCDGCAAGIKAMLKRTQGIISVDVSYERKEAVVEYEPEKITPERIIEAITNLGYKASVKG